MKTSDYYHEIAIEAKRLADAETEASALALDNGVEAGQIATVEAKAAEAAAHETFNEHLGNLWMVSTFEADEAAVMGEIIEASNARFPDQVQGRPSDALRRAAEETMRADIQNGAFDMIKQRLIDRGYDLRR